MFELNSTETTFYLQAWALPKVEDLLSFIMQTWPGAVLVDADSSKWLYLSDVKVEVFFSKGQLFFIVEDEKHLAMLEDPDENSEYFYIGWSRVEDTALDVLVKSIEYERGVSMARDATDVTMLLRDFWNFTIQSSVSSRNEFWNSWSQEAIRGLAKA